MIVSRRGRGLSASRSFLGVVALIYLAVAYLLTERLGLFIGDDLARLGNASYVLFSRAPHLAAIGFVWTPLPSVLEFPLLVALRPFGAQLMAGALLTAIASTANVYLIWRILGQIGVSRATRATLTAIFAFDPFVLLYAGNGMSEAPFLTTLLLVMSALVGWVNRREPGQLMWAGVASAIAFTMRYEGAMLLAAGAGVVIAVWWSNEDASADRLEGELLAFAAPLAYVGGLWMFASWLITGSPFYFITGGDNSAAQSLQALRASGAGAAVLYHRPLAALVYLVTRCTLFWPALLPLGTLVAVLYGVRRRLFVLSPLLCPITVLALHLYLLYSGNSYGEFRYYVYAFPLGVLATGYLLAALPLSLPTRLGRITTALVLGASCLSMPSTLWAMDNAQYGRQERPFLATVLHQPVANAAANRWLDDQAMARYIDRLHLGRGKVVLDTTNGYVVALLSANEQQFVIPSDPDWGSVLAQLPQFDGYVAVSTRTNPSSVILRRTYPALFATPPPWAHVVHTFGSWRLYRIVPGGSTGK